MFRDSMNNFSEGINLDEIILKKNFAVLYDMLFTWFKTELLDDDIKLATFIQDKNVGKT